MKVNYTIVQLLQREQGPRGRSGLAGVELRPKRSAGGFVAFASLLGHRGTGLAHLCTSGPPRSWCQEVTAGVGFTKLIIFTVLAAWRTSCRSTHSRCLAASRCDVCSAAALQLATVALVASSSSAVK